jgi:outer membrane lipoprotein carrier protein
LPENRLESPTMLYRRFIRLTSVAILAAMLGGAIPANAQSVTTLLDRLERKYDSIQALRASFTQTLKSAFSSETASLEGRLVLAGEKYRVETKSQTMVTDGITTWIYLADENQVLINSADSDEGGFPRANFSPTLI